MPLDLPTDLLRSLVAIADTGGIGRAAARVHRTQPAVSLQVKRLESLLGVPLFRKQGRGLVLTEAGERLLAYARRILALNDEAVAALAPAALAGPVRLGTIQDFADSVLPEVLARFAAENAGVRLDVRVGGSASLLDDLAAGGLDLALTADLPGRAAPAALLLHRPMRWIGARAAAPADEVALAVIESPCPFREAAIAALDGAGRPWRIVYTSPSLAGVRAAVRAGLGVTCRTDALAGDGLRALGPEDGLPPLPEARFALTGRPSPSAAAGRLAEILAAALS